MNNEQIIMRDEITGILETFIESNHDIKTNKILQYQQHETERINNYCKGYLVALGDIKKDLENELYKKKPFGLDLDSLCKSNEQSDKFKQPKSLKCYTKEEDKEESENEEIW